MRDSLRARRVLIVILVLLSLALSLLPLGCSQGGIVEGEVQYKYVTGMKDRVYVIIVLNEPADVEPSIVVDPKIEPEEKQILESLFPPDGNLVVDNSAEMQIEAFYTNIAYRVSLHLMSGDEYTYYQAYRADREDFNRLKVGSTVKLDTEASDVGPRIKSIVE